MGVEVPDSGLRELEESEQVVEVGSKGTYETVRLGLDRVLALADSSTRVTVRDGETYRCGRGDLLVRASRGLGEG